jgi:hypothetical protein
VEEAAATAAAMAASGVNGRTLIFFVRTLCLSRT